MGRAAASGDVIAIEGKIALPAGSGLNLTTLSVSAPTGTYSVSATGAFSASVFAGAGHVRGVVNR